MKKPLLLIAAICATIVPAFALDKEQFIPIAIGMMSFPDNPTAAAFKTLEAKMDALPEIQDKEEARHITATGAAFLAAAQKKHGYPFQGTGIFTTLAKEIISEKGSFAKYILDDTDVDTSKFDVWWMSYLGSQDDEYLRKILKWAGSPRPKNDAVRSEFIQSAAWSFQSNCLTITGVKDFAKKASTDPRYKDQWAFLKTCLETK